MEIYIPSEHLERMQKSVEDVSGERVRWIGLVCSCKVLLSVPKARLATNLR